MFQNILSTLSLFIAILILITLGGRLLGLRITFLRGLLTAILGLGIGTGLATLGVYQGNGVGSKLAAIGFLVFPLLVTMAFMVLGELLAKPGSLIRLQSQLMKPPHPLRVLRLRFERMLRYMQIVSIITRNGLSSYFSNSDSEWIEQVSALVCPIAML